MKVLKSKEASHAVMLGGLCSLAYLVVYVVRNVLGACTPQMLESGTYSTEKIGVMSSVFFVVYALGQLVNGIIGDHIKAKYMMAIGLLGAGICNGVFLLSEVGGAQIVLYGCSGFFLSMIYAPMTRVVAENTSVVYAERCGIGFSVAAFLGSPIAGLLAGATTWNLVFALCGSSLLVMAAAVFLLLGISEKKGIVRYREREQKKENSRDAAVLIRRRIVRFTLLSAITGIIRTSVIFWLPTYLNQYLEYGTASALRVYAVITFCTVVTPFLAAFLIERLRGRMSLSMVIFFAVSTVCFFLCYLVRQPVLNSIFLAMAIIGSNGVSSLIWCRYCPGLSDTGMVSTATGYLDFISYVAAALANLMFADAVAKIGWGKLILVWCAIMIVGIGVSIYREDVAKQ